MSDAKISGSLTLDQIRLTCGTTENLEFCKLTRLKKLPAGDDGKNWNLAQFEDVDPADPTPPDLVLVAVPPGGNAATIIADQLAKGKKSIFDEHIFVEDKDTEVLGFR